MNIHCRFLSHSKVCSVSGSLDWNRTDQFPMSVFMASWKLSRLTSAFVLLMEREVPVTTDPAKIQAGLQAERPEALTVLFCTYQSLPLVEQAQAAGPTDFDLVVFE